MEIRKEINRLFFKYKNMLLHQGVRYTISNIINEFHGRYLKVKVFIQKKNKLNQIDFYKTFFNELYENESSKNDLYVPYHEYEIKLNDDNIKYIAFYLPQYHPIKENNEWWGKGFTEWTNVSKAVPQFLGHYQPHLPGEFGFYDLRVKDIQHQQVKLAKNYGIYGFCFYYYWFGGKKVLDMPLNQFAGSDDIDFPFCICWANENWTRRWDGKEYDILLKQKHSREDDIDFINSVIPFFKNENYIRVDGKPLLVVYRPLLLPEPEKTADRWRKHCKETGIGDIYLGITTSYDSIEPGKIGFDFAIEFPPNNFICREITDRFILLNERFNGKIYDYDELIDKSSDNSKVKYELFRGITPSWDNTARKGANGRIFWNSRPDSFLNWLNEISDFTCEKHKSGKRFVFINAWNEWAEGAHLEPDRRYGYAWLDAVARVHLRLNSPQRSAASGDNLNKYL